MQVRFAGPAFHFMYPAEDGMKRSCIFFIFVFIVSGAGYASYDQALELYQQKKHAESLKILGDELTTENDFKEGSPNFKIRYLAAHDHWKLGNKEAVINHFKRCMEIKKDEVGP